MNVDGVGEANVDGIAHILVTGERGFAADGGHLDSRRRGVRLLLSLLFGARSTMSRSLLLDLRNRIIGVEVCCS